MVPWRVTSPFSAASPGPDRLKAFGSVDRSTGSVTVMCSASREWATAASRIRIACTIEIPALEPMERAMVETMVPSVRWMGASRA